MPASSTSSMHVTVGRQDVCRAQDSGDVQDKPEGVRPKQVGGMGRAEGHRAGPRAVWRGEAVVRAGWQGTVAVQHSCERS